MIEILSVLANLSQIASLALQAGLPRAMLSDGSSVVVGFEKLKLTKSQLETLEREGAKEIISILYIDKGLLSDISHNIQNCIEKYRAAIKVAVSQSQQHVVDRAAERCVCDALNRIKRRNNGVLPSGDFERWWTSYRCTDDFDY